MEIALVKIGALLTVVILVLLLQLLLQQGYLLLQANRLLVLPLLAETEQFPVEISLLPQFIDLCSVDAQNAGKLLPCPLFAVQGANHRLDVLLDISNKTNGDLLWGGLGSEGALSLAGAVGRTVRVVAEPPSLAQHL